MSASSQSGPLRILAIGILLAGLLLRVPKLGLRPMHHDEANQAVKFGRLLEAGEYRYDRLDHHGPSLYYLSLPLARLLCGSRFSDCSEAVLRLVTVIFGMGIILFILQLGEGLSRVSVLLAAFFAAISPALVYYSRFFIQETLLAFFALAALIAGWRYCRHPTTAWALASGFSVGMMAASKETWLIIVCAAGGALLLTRLTSGKTAPAAVKAKPIFWLHLAAALSAALVTAVLFYSSFFSNPAGIIDSLAAYRNYLSRAASTGPHVQPWYFYLKLLVFSRYGRGPTWSEGLVLFLAAAGGVAAFIEPRAAGERPPLLARFMAFYSLLATAAYSLIPYKTPWNLLPFYVGMVILAGHGCRVLISRLPHGPWRYAGILLLATGALQLGWQCYRANFVYYADSRNPYVYAQTSDDFMRLVKRVRDVARVSPDGEGTLIKVITDPTDAWPLPWYLRSFRQVGYWRNADAAALLAGTPVLVVSAAMEKEISDRLTSPYVEEYYELRPGALLALYIRPDLWTALISSRTP